MIDHRELFARPSTVPSRKRCRRAFTLIEVLIVVVLLGIAGSLIVPSMSQTGVLQVQAAVRTLVSDITYLQGEAVAYQARRAIWFGKVAQYDSGTQMWSFVDGNGYVMAEVNGAVLDLNFNHMIDPGSLTRPYARNFDEPKFGGSTIDFAIFDASAGNDTAILIFDELGGPVQDLSGPTPSNGGSVQISGQGSTWVVQVQPYTGRVTVTKTADILH